MVQTKQPYVMRHPQTVAWLVVLSGFAVFCTICASISLGAYWFFFKSQVNLTVHLTVSRGGVDIVPPGQTQSTTYREQADLVPSFKATTDNNSQAYLTFDDNSAGQTHTVATVFLLSNSTVALTQSTRPRFEWSRNTYAVSLDNVGGQFEVNLPSNPQMGHSVELHIRSKTGEVYLNQPGDYQVDMFDAMVDVYVEAGEAQLRTLSGQVTAVSVGKHGRLIADAPAALIEPLPYQTLNPDFGQSRTEPLNRVLNGWACANDSLPTAPWGVYQRINDGQRLVLELMRQSTTGADLGHAETRCLFSFAPSGQFETSLDITGYRSLSIRAHFKIKDQNVATCGVLGTECPVMLMLTYLGRDESVQVERFGFYAISAQPDAPLTCDTCLKEHEKINQDVWYSFNSGDLLKLLPDNTDEPQKSRMPRKLIEIRVYSSGHLYDVEIADLTVRVGLPTTSIASN